MMIKLTTIVLSLGLLAACASTPVEYKNNPRWSEARNVMEAAHIHGMQDLPYKKYEEAQEDALKKGMKLDTGPSLLGGTTFGALNYISPPTGFSSGAAGVMGLASWLLIDTKHPGVESHIFVWMPQTEAKTTAEASEKLDELFRAALIAATKDVALPSGYEYGLVSREGIVFRAIINGGDCGKMNGNLYIKCGFNVSQTISPIVENAPENLGGSQSYVWRRSGKGDHLFVGHSKIGKTDNTTRGRDEKYYAFFPDLEFYKAFTQRLPKWIYAYLAPKSWGHEINGKYVFINYPVVINQGRVLYFIEPAPATAAR